CSIPHTDDEIQALVQKLIDEDMVRPKEILDLALQFENACTAKDDLRKAYEKCNDIPQESHAFIDTFLKEVALSCSPNALGDLTVTMKDLSVFSPKPSMHYLNITKRNVVKVFLKDTVLESGSG
ncbi:RNA-directed DNA polymerase, eukaryota, partial [Tanacetum coccineum]